MNGDALSDLADKVSDRNDFLAFVGHLVANLQSHPEEWENDSLESFLESFCGFVASAERYYKNVWNKSIDMNAPSWRIIADSLLAAKTYE